MKLKTQDVWILVDKMTDYMLAYEDRGEPISSIDQITDKYLLTKDEIIKLVGDAFQAGRTYQQGEYSEYHGGKENEAPHKQQLIDNLFK